MSRPSNQQQIIQKAQASYGPTQKTIKVKPDTKAGQKLMVYIPDWALLVGGVLVMLFVLAIAIRKSGLSTLILKVINLWKETAFGKVKK